VANNETTMSGVVKASVTYVAWKVVYNHGVRQWMMASSGASAGNGYVRTRTAPTTALTARERTVRSSVSARLDPVIALLPRW